MEIRELLEKTNKLPNVPDVVKELIQQLNNPNADYSKIASKVAQDQTLSLKILRLVNSAHFGLRRKVSSIDEAVVMLGMARLKTMVIASGVVGSVKDVKGLDLRRFWSEAFFVAAVAKWLAEKTGNVDADTAFTVGLIHNIGRLLLHLSKPDIAQSIQARIDATGCNRSDAEMECLGFPTPQAGQALLDLWRFPPELGIAILQHKQPTDFENASPVAAVINLACGINAAKLNNTDPDTLRDNFPMDVVKIAGLSGSVLSDLSDALALESGLEGLID
ncbi:MAG: HDOD domain-containing protein [Pontibacterium sp.]